MAKERTGFPTQNPEASLERIIKASSNSGDIVLAPFCGCATTLVAAENLGRQWVGIDKVKQAAKEVKKRMIKMGGGTEDIWRTVKIRDMRKSLASLQRDEWGKLPPPRTHAKRLYGEQDGKCKSCGCHQVTVRNLEVDHIVPKSKEGTDHESNLQLLCGACNNSKSDRPQAYLDKELERLEITLHR